eukprot:6466438-Amphidinium_carterae.1
MARKTAVGPSARGAMGGVHPRLRHLFRRVVTPQPRHPRDSLVSTWGHSAWAGKGKEAPFRRSYRCRGAHLEGRRAPSRRWREAAGRASKVMGLPPGPDLGRVDPAPVDGTVWRALEKAPGIEVGDAVIPSVHLVQLGERSVDRQGGKEVALGRSGALETRTDFIQRVMGGESLDARILPVQYNKRGERERPWAS